VRREYKRLAIGANYEGPFALQLIMAAAPPAVDFAWEVQGPEDSFKHSLHNTVVGKGHWNTLACSNKLFPHGVLEDRKWADPTLYIVRDSHLHKAGVFTDKIQVGAGVTIDYLEMAFRDGPLFKDSPDSEKILFAFTSAQDAAAVPVPAAFKAANAAKKKAVSELKMTTAQEPGRKGDDTAAGGPDKLTYDAWCTAVKVCEEGVRLAKLEYEVVKKDSAGKMLAKREAHGPINMEWAFVTTLTGQLCGMFQVLAKELKDTMFPTDFTQQPVGAQGNLLTQQRMRKAETACKVKYGEDASLAVVFDLFLDVDWNPAMGYGPNKFDKDKPEKTDRIGGAATTTDPMLNIIVQMFLILRVLPPLPHDSETAVAWDLDGEEAGVPDTIRNVFSKDMHKQLFFGMQSLSGMLPGRGWADRNMQFYPVMTEEFMIQWWTDLIMFSQAGLDATSRIQFGARAEHAGCLSYVASHLLEGYLPFDQGASRLGGCWAMKELQVCPEIVTQFGVFPGNFVSNSRDRVETGPRELQIDFNSADHNLASNRIDADWRLQTKHQALNAETQASALEKLSGIEIVAFDGTVTPAWTAFEADLPGGLFGNEVNQQALDKGKTELIASTSSGDQVYSVVGNGLHPPLLVPASKDESGQLTLDQVVAKGQDGVFLFLKDDLTFGKEAVEALLECKETYKQIVDAHIRLQPNGAVAKKAKEDEKNNVEPTDEDIKSLNSKHVRKRLFQGEMVWLRHCGDAGFSISYRDKHHHEPHTASTSYQDMFPYRRDKNIFVLTDGLQTHCYDRPQMEKMAKEYMTRSRPKDSTNQTTAIGWKFRDELDEAKKVQIKEQCHYIVTTAAEQAAAGQAPFDLFIVAGDPVMIAPNDQFCMGMAATFLSVFRDEHTSNWKAVVYGPTVGPSRDKQTGELIAITSKNCDYNVQLGVVILDLFKENLGRETGTGALIGKHENMLQLWPRRGPSAADGSLLSNGHRGGDGMHPGHKLDALDLGNASTTVIKYAVDRRKQFCKSYASPGAVNPPTPLNKRKELDGLLSGTDAEKALDGHIGSKKQGRVKKMKLNRVAGERFLKKDNWLYMFQWSSAVKEGNCTTWADKMTGRAALLPAVPGGREATPYEVVCETYAESAKSMKLQRPLDVDLVSVQGTLILTKILLQRDKGTGVTKNWYYDATITLSCDKTLKIPPLKDIVVNYRGSLDPLGSESSKIQTWLRRVLKSLGDDKKLFSLIWPNFLKWFTLAQEKMRAPITKAKAMDRTGDILTAAHGFTGRDNATFVKTISPAPKAPARKGGAPKAKRLKPAATAERANFSSPLGSTPGPHPVPPTSPAVQTSTAWSTHPGNDLWTTRIRESLDEMMAKSDGTINSDDVARGLCIEAQYRTCQSGRSAATGTRPAGTGSIYKALAHSAESRDLNKAGRKVASKSLKRALKLRQDELKTNGTWNKEDDTDTDDSE